MPKRKTLSPITLITRFSSLKGKTTAKRRDTAQIKAIFHNMNPSH